MILLEVVMPKELTPTGLFPAVFEKALSLWWFWLPILVICGAAYVVISIIGWLGGPTASPRRRR